MRWRQQNDKPQKDGYYFIKEGDSGGGRYYFETIGGGQWRWHEYSNCVSEKHKFEWLDESLPADIEQEAATYAKQDFGPNIAAIDTRKYEAYISAARQYMGEIDKARKEAKIELLWELIEEWQDARDNGEDIHAPKFSFNDIEVDFYEKLEQIDPSAKNKKQ